MYVLVNNKYSKTTNSNVFNNSQGKLLYLINNQIQKDFQAFKIDSNRKECLMDVDSIPRYHIDDFIFSFYKDEVHFEIHWALPGACRAVDGTIVTFTLKEVSQYFK